MLLNPLNLLNIACMDLQCHVNLILFHDEIQFKNIWQTRFLEKEVFFFFSSFNENKDFASVISKY